jgi:hypothetical protein
MRNARLIHAQRKRHDRRRSNGFTLAEVMVVSFLTTLLALILSAAWAGLGRPLVEAAARAQIAQEVNLAAAALARDFGGTLPGTEGQLGGLTDGKLVGHIEPAGSSLRLCFDGGALPNGLADWGDPDTVITYEVQDGNLVRWNESSGTTFTVARYVQQLQVADDGSGVEIRLRFVHRNLDRTYTLIGLEP